MGDKLRELGVPVQWNTELIGLAQERGEVTATLKQPDGTSRKIRAAWIVGCDGAHSSVRKLSGFTFEGSSYEVHLMQADVHVDFPNRGDGDEILAFLSKNGPLAMFPLFKDGRYRVIVVLMPGTP